MLVGLAAGNVGAVGGTSAVLFYLATYGFMTVGVFALLRGCGSGRGSEADFWGDEGAGVDGPKRWICRLAGRLGKTESQTLFKVLLPNIKPSLLTGIILTFAHTIGEFGVVLMIGGNIPGKTRTVSVTIYDEVESFNYHAANMYALILLGISFITLFLMYLYNRRLDQINVIR
jgi:hypothetical protein